MFGHNDQHHHDEAVLPVPDEHLEHGAAPAGDDTASAYIDDVAPVTTAPVTQPSAAPIGTQGGGTQGGIQADQDDAGLGADTSDTADVTASAPTVVPAEPAEPAAATPVIPADTDKLLDIKQQALQQLTPLVGHLEQSPEEKFRTTMMMIQASDNHELVPAAYEAAGQITDEKVRAQALLDIVNEINYFTHNNSEA